MDLIETYHSFAWWLQRQAPGGDKFLHINAGLSLWVLAALVSRRSFASWWSLGPMLAIEIANELADFADGRGWSLSDTIADMICTWAWPVSLVLIFRSRRRAASEAYRHQAELAPAPQPRSPELQAACVTAHRPSPPVRARAA